MIISMWERKHAFLFLLNRLQRRWGLHDGSGWLDIVSLSTYPASHRSHVLGNGALATAPSVRETVLVPCLKGSELWSFHYSRCSWWQSCTTSPFALEIPPLPPWPNAHERRLRVRRFLLAHGFSHWIYFCDLAWHLCSRNTWRRRAVYVTIDRKQGLGVWAQRLDISSSDPPPKEEPSVRIKHLVCAILYSNCNTSLGCKSENFFFCFFSYFTYFPKWMEGNTCKMDCLWVQAFGY